MTLADADTLPLRDTTPRGDASPQRDAPPPRDVSDRDAPPLRRWTMLWLWLAYALLTLGLLGNRPVVRAQEARVLETSRQMLDATSWDGWILPELNGEPRLRKPPLCYWYTLASYRAFGHVDEFAGRLPTLLLGWLTIAVTYRFARDVGGRRMAFFAAAVLATGFLFVRFTRSAETDTPAMLGVVVAQWAIWRGSRPCGRLRWFHLAALGIALAGMSKGGPAVFPVVFLALVAIANRSWRPIGRFAASGAPLVALGLIVPWFAYVRSAKGGEQVAQEVSVVLTGSNHFGLFYEYLPPLLVGTLPWAGWLVLACVAAFMLRKTFDPVRRTALLTIASVALPLALALNVQPHYLLPMLPGCAMLVGWWIVRATDGTAEPRLFVATRTVMAASVIVLALAGPAALAAGFLQKHGFQPIDAVAALTFGAAAAWLIVRYRDALPDVQHAAFAGAMLIVMPIAIGHWAPTLKSESLRTIAPRAEAAAAQRLGTTPGPFLAVGGDGNIALAFYLRRPIWLTQDEAEVRKFIAAHPNGVVVVERPIKRPQPPLLPALLTPVATEVYDDNVIEFYTSR